MSDPTGEKLTDKAPTMQSEPKALVFITHFASRLVAETNESVCPQPDYFSNPSANRDQLSPTRARIYGIKLDNATLLPLAKSGDSLLNV
jgi:hypothetical protein